MGQDCKYCGAYISGDADRCPACGKRVKGAAASHGAAAAAYAERREETAEARAEQYTEDTNAEKGEYKTYTYKDEYNKRYGEGASEGNKTQSYVRPAAQDADGDVARNRSICYLCYFGFLFLVPFLTRRDSDFVKFHSNQGLLLLIADVAVSVCGKLPIIGWLISIIGTIFIIMCFVKGLTSVSKGTKEPLPVIGEFNILK